MRAFLRPLPFVIASSLLLGCAAEPEGAAAGTQEGEVQQERERTIGTADFHFDRTKVGLTSVMTRSRITFGGVHEEYLSVRAALSRDGVESVFADCSLFGHEAATEQAPAHDWLGCFRTGGSMVTQFVIERTGESFSLRQGDRNFSDPTLTALGVDQDHRPHALSTDARKGDDAFALVDAVAAAVGSVAQRPSAVGPVTIESWSASEGQLSMTLRFGAEAPFKRSRCYDSTIQPRLVNQPTTPSGVATFATKDELVQRISTFLDGMVAKVESGECTAY
jgi:hypothetical protein